jgi:hypothetical protein
MSEGSESEAVWTDASLVNNALNNLTREDEPVGFATLFEAEDEWMHGYHKLFERTGDDELYKIRDCDFAVSNIGKYVYDKFKDEENDSFKLSEMYYGDMQNSVPTLTYGCLLYASYWNDRLNMLLTTNSSSISVDRAQQLLGLIERNLIKMALSP